MSSSQKWGKNIKEIFDIFLSTFGRTTFENKPQFFCARTLQPLLQDSSKNDRRFL